MNGRHVTWSTVLGMKNGKQLQVDVTVDLEEFARNFALKAEATKSKVVKPCGAAAIVKIVGYPARG